MDRAALLIAIAYLIGSIPFGLLIAEKLYKVDIRAHGSGNIGATNMFRTLGILPGTAALILDIAKGALPVWLAIAMFPAYKSDSTQSMYVILTGLAAITGHNWSVFLRFNGGKGVATSAGVLVVLFPKVLAILVAVLLAVLMIFRMVSLASLSAAFLFPVLIAVFYRGNLIFLVFSLVITAAIVYRHKSNIGRLLRGEESRLGRDTETRRSSFAKASEGQARRHGDAETRRSGDKED